jgi:hypothetical protein
LILNLVRCTLQLAFLTYLTDIHTALVYVRIDTASNFSPALPRDAKMCVELWNTAPPTQHKYDAKTVYQLLGKTEAVPMQLDHASFTWYQDFAILQPDRRHPIRLVLRDARSGSSKMVGHVHFDTECMKAGYFYDVDASVVSTVSGWGRGAQLRGLICVEPILRTFNQILCMANF